MELTLKLILTERINFTFATLAFEIRLHDFVLYRIYSNI